MAEDCTFCKIAEGKIPACVIYDDSKIMAFLDIFPIRPGHALVIPKKHSLDVFDTDEEIMVLMAAVAKKISPAVMEGMGADGINIGMNNRVAAGQEIMHAHIHVIPRFKDDGLKAWSKDLFRDDKHKQEVYGKIRDCVR